jgi:exodeoxyribonuclease V gamma subunit
MDRTLPGRVHLFVLAPSKHYWADLALRRASRKTGVLEEAPEMHPGGLLWAFGRNSQDLQKQLAGTLQATGGGGVDLESPPPKDTLLGRLQLSCREAAPTEPHLRLQIQPGDASLTVHSTHTRLREMEVCRDRILQALNGMEGLRHEEILLLLANPKEQAPYVEAAFQGGSEGWLPFRMLGFGQAVPSAFATTLEFFLETLGGRFTLEDLQTLLESPLIADKFEFLQADEEGQTLVTWLADAQFRWGVTPEHRRVFQDVPENRWNLLWALGRLGLGAVVEEGLRDVPLQSTERSLGSIPLERASGLGLRLLAKLAGFVRVLQQARSQWNEKPSRPIADWNAIASSIAKAFVSTRDSLASQHATEFQNTILPGLARAGAGGVELDAGAYRRLLSEKLALLTESSNRGSGGIKVADLRHYAGVPARMILIAGLDDGAFPKRDDRPDWHPFAKDSRPGDPSVRDADRHALLLALLSCEERLVLSYRGGSDQDSKERPPSTALADLLSVIDQTLQPEREGVAPHRQVLFVHPLNGFSPAAFSAENSVHQQGMNLADHRSAHVLARREALIGLRGPWSSSLPAEDFVPASFQMLRKLLSEPSALLLERLGIRLPEEALEIQSGDLIQTGSLEKWSIKDDLLAAMLRGQDAGLIQQRLAASGKIPRGKLGELLLFESDSKLRDLQERVQGLIPLGADARVVRGYRIALAGLGARGGDLVLEGVPQRGWYQKAGDATLLYFSPSTYKQSEEKRELGCLLEALAIVASADPRVPPPNQLNAHFSDALYESPLPSRNHAVKALAQLIPLLRLARQYALPFWPGVEDCHQWKEGNYGSDAPPACNLPATRYAFRGCWNPFEWSPEGLPSWLADPELPFAVRILKFITDWRRSLVGSPPCHE